MGCARLELGSATGAAEVAVLWVGRRVMETWARYWWLSG